jgi:hypothetical protein
MKEVSHIRSIKRIAVIKQSGERKIIVSPTSEPGRSFCDITADLELENRKRKERQKIAAKILQM